MITLARLIAGISPHSQRSFLRGRDNSNRTYWAVQNAKEPTRFDLFVDGSQSGVSRLAEMEFLATLRAGRSLRRGRRYLRGVGSAGQFWVFDAGESWLLRLDPRANLSIAQGLSIAGAGARHARPALEAGSSNHLSLVTGGGSK